MENIKEKLQDIGNILDAGDINLHKEELKSKVGEIYHIVHDLESKNNDTKNELRKLKEILNPMAKHIHDIGYILY